MLAPTDTKKPIIAVVGFTKFLKNTLLGFIDVEFPFGMVIKDITVHHKGDKRWIGMPAKPRLDVNGNTQRDAAGKILYAPVLEWTSPERFRQFTTKVLELLDEKYPGAAGSTNQTSLDDRR